MTTDVDERTIEANFREQCERHDIAFAMSDDHSVWKRGHEERLLLEAHAKLLAPGRAAAIFNEVVVKQFGESGLVHFRWTERDANA